MPMSPQERERTEADGSADAAQRQLSRQWWAKGNEEGLNLYQTELNAFF